MANNNWHNINDPGWLPPVLRRQVEEKLAAEAREEEQLKREYDEYCEQEALKASKKPEFSNEHWERSGQEGTAPNPDIAYEGEEILLKANWKDMVEGAGIQTTIRNTSTSPTKDLEAIKAGRLGKKNEVNVPWKVKLPKSHTEKSSYGFEFYYDGSLGKKYSKTAPLKLSARTACEFIEIPDTLFYPKSAIAQLDDKGAMVGALSAVYLLVKNNQGSQIVVCGHATAEDEGMFSALEVSNQRALAIKALFANEEEIWIDSIHDFSDTRDIQQFLTTLNSFYGWPCDPNGVDGKIGAGTRTAIKAYKAEYNKRFDGSLADSDVIDCEMYRSMFRVLRWAIEQEYKRVTKEESLPAISWGHNGAGAYGCSTSFAPDSTLNTSKKGSRTEVYLVAGDVNLTFTNHTDAKTPVTTDKCPLFGGRFERKAAEYQFAKSNILRVTACEGPKTTAFDAKATYKVTGFSQEATEDEKKTVSWCVKLGEETKKEFKRHGETLALEIPHTWAGDTISVYPYINGPDANLKVDTKVGPYAWFNGKELTLYGSDCEKITSFDGWSGSGEIDCAKENGPIPDGKWIIKQTEIQQCPKMGILDRMAENAAGGEWAGGEDAWGKERVQIYAMKAETKGRLRFYIHGGKNAASGYGVALKEKCTDFISIFRQQQKNVVLIIEDTLIRGGAVSKGSKGPIVEEINIRLSGFGGGVPKAEFDDETERKVKNFERAYMKRKEPTGIVDEKVAQAIDEFGEKWVVSTRLFDTLKCKCGKSCGGFGKGRHKGKHFLKKDAAGSSLSDLEKSHRYEYPGIHRSLLWALRGLDFYLANETMKAKVNEFSSGYRCNDHPLTISKQTTNHMGKAVDVLYANQTKSQWVRPTNKEEQRALAERIRDICKRQDTLNAQIGWAGSNRFAMESAAEGATTWVHIDVRIFAQEYLSDRFFCGDVVNLNGQKLSNIIAEKTK